MIILGPSQKHTEYFELCQPKINRDKHFPFCPIPYYLMVSLSAIQISESKLVAECSAAAENNVTLDSEGI